MIPPFDRFALCATILLAGLCQVGAVQAADPGDSTKQLVQELGSSSFQKRQRADEQLERLGNAAIPALTQGLQSSDREVRSRCRALIRRIRESEEAQRLQRFIARGLQPGDEAFPGWSEYQKLLGSDLEARTLFVQLYTTDPQFLSLALEDREKANRVFEDRCMRLIELADRFRRARRSITRLRPQAVQLVQQSKILNTEELAILGQVYGVARCFQIKSGIEGKFESMFEEQIQSVVEGGKINRRRFSELMHLSKTAGYRRELEEAVRPVFADMIEQIVTDILVGNQANNDDFNGVRELTESAPSLVSEDLRAQVRPVFAAAVDQVVRVPAGEFSSFRGCRQAAFQLFQVGTYIELNEVVPLAVKVATAERWSAKTRREAIYQVGKFGDQSQVESLQPLLGDTTPIYRFGQVGVSGFGFTSCLGDEALAAMIHLSGGELADYGFATPVSPKPTFQDREWWGWGYYGKTEEESDQNRRRAIANWKTRDIEDSIHNTER